MDEQEVDPIDEVMAIYCGPKASNARAVELLVADLRGWCRKHRVNLKRIVAQSQPGRRDEDMRANG